MLIVLSTKACEYADDQDRISKVIAKSAVLTELDAICSGVDRPASLKFNRRALAGNSFTAHVGQRYGGSASFADIRSMARNWAIRNGWEVRSMIDTSEFLSVELKKEKKTVYIGKAGGEFSYGCNEITR